MLPDQRGGFEPDEIDLVSRTCNGDRAAAEQLFAVVLGPTIAAISRYRRCEDLPDELFVHLSENNWRRLRTWSGKANLKSWIRIVARRLSVQMVKGWTRSISLSDGEDRDVADGHDSVLDRLIESERGMELLNAIERLESPRDQAVLRMY
jgi:DNA-directed RNA polymerase specialized sigma24 family protein